MNLSSAPVILGSIPSTEKEGREGGREGGRKEGRKEGRETVAHHLENGFTHIIYVKAYHIAYLMYVQ
jgi:predicted transposase YdaD